MEESYTYLSTVPMSGREEEVICGIDNGCAILQEDNQVPNELIDPPSTFEGDVCEEVVVSARKIREGIFFLRSFPQVQEDVSETIVPDETQGEIMYLTPDNVNVLTVMQQAAPLMFQDNMMVSVRVR